MWDHKKDNILVTSAVSGTGRTTLVSRLSKSHDDIRVSISHTTRQPREGEVYGVHCRFVPRDEFEPLIKQGTFLEHANMFSNYYGASIAGVDSSNEKGYDVTLEVDVQGATQVRGLLPEADSIFVLPPSSEVPAQRLIDRNTNSEEVIQTRLSEVRHEIKQSVLSDYVVADDDLSRAETDLFHIIRTGRLKKSAQQGFISNPLENS